MQETLEPQTSPRLSNWRTEWNIADLLRAADAEEPVEEQTFLQDSEPSGREAGWAETESLLVRIGERIRRNNSRLADLEAANRELDFGLALQVQAVSSRMKRSKGWWNVPRRRGPLPRTTQSVPKRAPPSPNRG
jgi:hypothetical protein